MQKKMKTKIASIIMLFLILMFTIVNPLSIFAESENVESEPTNGELQVTTDDGSTPIIVEETDDNNDQIKEETTVTEEKQDSAEQNTKDESASAINEETTSIDEKTTAEADKKNEEPAKKEVLTKDDSTMYEENTITNIEIPTTSIYVLKIWEGNKQDSVKVNILANGVKVKEVVLNDENYWSAEVDVNPYDENGNLITYSVEEVTIPGYTTEIGKTCFYSGLIEPTRIGTPKSLAIIDYCTPPNYSIYDEIQRTEYYVITNREIPTKSIKVTKNWEGEQQDSVTVNILGNGKIVKEVVLNEENNWTATVDVKQTDESGNPITYSVEEETVPGYTTEIERIACTDHPSYTIPDAWPWEPPKWNQMSYNLGSESENIGTFNSQTTVDECQYYQDEEYTITNKMIEPTTPTITKDVEGKDHLDVDFEKSFNYNIKATVPELLVGYETLTIKDALNERLAIEDVKVLVGGSASDLTASVNGQEVTLTLDRAQLENIKGKEITVQVTAHIKGDTPIENTENVATIQLNNEKAKASNVVTVKPKQPSTTEENGSDNGGNYSGNDRDDLNPDDPWVEPTTDEGEDVAEEPETTEVKSVETEQPKSKIP